MPGGPQDGPSPPGKRVVGVVSQHGKVRAKLRRGPSTDSKIASELAFGTRLYIDLEREKRGWYYVTVDDGRYGYIDKQLVKTNLPEPTSRLTLVKENETALELAARFYSDEVKGDQDLRFFVNVLEYVNRGPGQRGIYQPNPDDTRTRAWRNVRTTRQLL